MLKIIKIFLLSNLIILFSFHLSGQKVKFKKLSYSYICKTDDDGNNYVDTIKLFIKIKYKSINDIKNEISYIEWKYGFFTDSSEVVIRSSVPIMIKKGKLTSSSLYGNYTYDVKKNIFQYQIYLGDLKLSPDKLFFINFHVEYTMKYLFEYCDKGIGYLTGVVHNNNDYKSSDSVKTKSYIR